MNVPYTPIQNSFSVSVLNTVFCSGTQSFMLTYILMNVPYISDIFVRIESRKLFSGVPDSDKKPSRPLRLGGSDDSRFNIFLFQIL